MQELKTVTGNLEIEISRQLSLLEDFLLEKSKPIVSRASSIMGRAIITPNYYKWETLDLDGQRIQSKLLGDYRKLFALLRVFLQNQPSDVFDSLQESNDVILKIIEQNGNTDISTLQEAFDDGKKAYRTLSNLIARLYDTEDEEIILVPDTNALLYNHQLDKWVFDFEKPFTLLFVPAVISELDLHKVNHRAESVREKAISLIRQYKEFRSRGDIFDGVFIVKGKSKIAAVAIEPDMDNSLPWLKADNTDDRLLASSIEIMRQHPRKPVILVTRDINLQNKCDYAKVPYIEPPEPD
jgi:hypothetical protein